MDKKVWGFDMSKTKIEWAEEVWNPVTGCTKVSPGCKNCYAERMSKRLAGRFGYPADDSFRVTLHRSNLYRPLNRNKPRRIFVCSMGDLFHEDVPFSFIAQIYSVMALENRHTYMVLTKRPQRMKRFIEWYIERSFVERVCDVTFTGAFCHVMHGVTAENQDQANARIPVLLSIPAAKRFVSIEPMLGPVDLLKCYDKRTHVTHSMACTAGTLDLVICGGESGPGARPVHPEWVRGVRDQCKEAGVPFFFKQWGEWVEDRKGLYGKENMIFGNTVVHRVGKKAAGRMLDGKEYLEWPK